MHRPRQLRTGIILAILLVAAPTTRLEERRIAASAAAVEARAEGPSRVNAARLMQDVETLSAAGFEGRLPGSPGGDKAHALILRRFRDLRLKPIVQRPEDVGYEQPFPFTQHGVTGPVATNLMGYIEGSVEPRRFTTMTAHYDHLGVRDGQIYPGADDNASGVATMLAAAEYFTRHRPKRSILFIAFDAEEEGLLGSTFFVAHPAVPLSAIVLEVNLDMVSRGDRNELFAAGTFFSPELKAPLVEAARSRRLTLRFGHDRPNAGAVEDWTHASDHGPFHDAGIRFLYFGVEDHPDYHRPTDTADKIPRAFFVSAANLIVDVLRAFDVR